MQPSGDGPTNVTPSRSHSSANAGSSATNPQPTQAASAPLSRSARSSTAQVQVRPVGGGAQVASSRSESSRTKVAVRSARLGEERATVSIFVPASAASSRTAWISRIAASPRLTMATRLNNTDRAS